MALTPQPVPSSPEHDLAAWKADIEKRLRNMETGSGLPFSTSRGGTTKWLEDDASRSIAFFGKLASSTDQFEGFVFYDSNDHAMFMVRSDKPGIVHPEFQASWTMNNELVAVTGGTFAWVAAINPRSIYHEVLSVVVPVGSDAGTVGELRLRETRTGLVTDTLVSTANTFQWARFDWIIPVEPNAGNDPSFEIQARRASGAANFNVYKPNQSDWTSTALVPGADTNGNARWL